MQPGMFRQDSDLAAGVHEPAAACLHAAAGVDAACLHVAAGVDAAYLHAAAGVDAAIAAGRRIADDSRSVLPSEQQLPIGQAVAIDGVVQLLQFTR